MRPRIATGLGLIVVIYIGLALANPMTTTVHGDGYYTYLWARTIVYDGDLDFHTDYQVCADPWGLSRTPIGDDQNFWNMGPAIFWIPILAYDRLTHPAARSQNARVANACEEPLTDRAVTGTMVAGLAAILFGFLIARRYFSDETALFGAVGIGLFTSLAYYTTMMMSMGHAASSFAGGLLVLTWELSRKRPSVLRWGIQGAALGLAMLMRAQNAVLVVLPLATWLVQAAMHLHAKDARGTAKHVGAGFLFLGMTLLFFFPQSWFWHHTTGSWFTIPQGDAYVRWGSPMWHKALFSAMGLFPWTPIMWPTLIGLIALACRRRTRAMGIGFLVLFALDAYVLSCAYDWWGSVGAPGRRFDVMVVPFIVGLAAFGHELWRWASKRRPGAALFWAAALLFVPLTFCSIAVHVGVARGMRTDVAQGSPSLWRQTMDQIMDPIWENVGNPMTWPASIPFAIHYGTHPRRWDVVGAPELFIHDERTIRYRTFESTIVIAERNQELYVDGPVASEALETVRGETGIRLRDGTSRLFLPIHFTEAGFIELTVVPLAEDTPTRIGLTIEGSRLGTQRLEGDRTQRVRWTIPIGVFDLGINEAWIWVDGGDVLLVRAQLFDPIPSPEERQRPINMQILEERRRLTQ
jgi:hypothetical protein